MPFFEYTGTPYSVRPEIVEANRNAWQGLSEPGFWWSGTHRHRPGSAKRPHLPPLRREEERHIARGHPR